MQSTGHRPRGLTTRYSRPLVVSPQRPGV